MSQSAVQEASRASPAAGMHRRIVGSWYRTLASWLNRRRLLQDLSSLDDRLLDDVGISREDVLWRAGEPFWRP